MIRWIVAALLTAPLANAQEPTVLARTDVAVVTTDDLAFALLTKDPLPDGDLRSASDQERLPSLLEEVAYERTLWALASAEGRLEEPAFRARQVQMAEDEVVAHLRGHLINLPALPPQEQTRAYLEEHREEYRLPPQASWRFALFAASPEEVGGRAAAMDRALEAREAILRGEEFQEVARRMATPTRTGEPGEVIGPVEFQGMVLPVVEDALLTLPVGEVSEPLETPLGPVLLQVVSRDLNRFPAETNMLFSAGRSLTEERRQRLRDEVLSDLRERHPVARVEGVTPASPESTVVMTVGSMEVTLADLRRRAVLWPDPQAQLNYLLTDAGLADLLEHCLLLAEMRATGRDTSPELQAKADAIVRVELTERLVREAESASAQRISEEAILQHYRTHRQELTRTLATVEVLWLPMATLREMSGSDYGPDVLEAAGRFRQVLAEGLAIEDVLEMIQASGGTAEVARHENVDPARMPRELRPIVDSLEPGEWSEVRMGPDGAALVHLVERGPRVPPLTMVRSEILRTLGRGLPRSRPLRERLLEEHHYEVVVDPRRLARGENGEVMVLPEAPPEPPSPDGRP